MNSLYIFIHKDTGVLSLTVACCMDSARNKLSEHWTKYDMDCYSINYLRELPAAVWVNKELVS